MTNSRIVGETRQYKGQTYEFCGTRARTRKDGARIVVEVWRGQCSECGADFETTPLNADLAFRPNRRCDAHKKPGVRALKRKGGTPPVTWAETDKNQKAEIASLRRALRNLEKDLAAEKRARRDAEAKLGRR